MTDILGQDLRNSCRDGFHEHTSYYHGKRALVTMLYKLGQGSSRTRRVAEWPSLLNHTAEHIADAPTLQKEG